MKAKAKHDVNILMEDSRFSNFIEGNEYRMMLRGNDTIILIDENRCGFACSIEQFNEDFYSLDCELN